MCICSNDIDDEINDQLDLTVPKIPIVYSSKYNVKFCGLQKLHPFDAAKGQHILEYLIKSKLLNRQNYIKPTEISAKELDTVHTIRYIKSLKWSLNVAKIAEIPPLIFVPNYFVQRGYLKPMRFQTGGSVRAGQLALDYGWSINLGGGFHHCSGDKGGGFCPYADITLLIKTILNSDFGIKNVMIIDLDAHQGNGHERDFIDTHNIFIFDMYNYRIYPRDNRAKLAISCAVELRPFTKDKEYIDKLKTNLKSSFSKFRPDFIVFNAGTDILAGDPLGLLSISSEGVIERDEIVFQIAIENNIPIVMLLSGGYLRSSARVIADSIINLKNKGLLPRRF